MKKFISSCLVIVMNFKCGHDTVIYNGFRIDGEHDLAAGF